MELFQGVMQNWGSVPQWGLLGVVILAALKIIPVLRKQTFDREASQSQSWQEECNLLRQELKAQADECRRHEEGFKAEIKFLNEQVLGMRRQHVAEQIELINLIIKSVDAPQLQGMMSMLERVQAQLSSTQIGAAIIHAQKD